MSSIRLTCASCGLNLPDQEVSAERTPCPNCGQTTRSIHVSVTSSHESRVQAVPLVAAVLREGLMDDLWGKASAMPEPLLRNDIDQTLRVVADGYLKFDPVPATPYVKLVLQFNGEGVTPGGDKEPES